MLNIHPSILPLFPGLHTHARALAAGMAVHGCTVHEVTTELDAGPILGQAVVPVAAGDTPESLAAGADGAPALSGVLRRFAAGDRRPLVEARFLAGNLGPARGRAPARHPPRRAASAPMLPIGCRP